MRTHKRYRACFSLIQVAYHTAAQVLREGLSGSLSDIFLELFETEMKNFRQLNWDHLVADVSALLLPVSDTPRSGIALSKRMPSGEAERIQKAVQAFVVLREFQYAVSHRKDERLPLKEENFPMVRMKEVYELSPGEFLSLSLSLSLSCSFSLPFLLIFNREQIRLDLHIPFGSWQEVRSSYAGASVVVSVGSRDRSQRRRQQ
jgi:hypothetical protein